MTRRIAGFDYLRVVFATFVIAWHTRCLGISGIFVPAARYTPGVADVVYINLLNLAVPVFLLMSLFLYVGKREENGPAYFRKRARQLAMFLLFWVPLFIVLGKATVWSPERGAVMNVLLFVLSGASTLFYFVVHLLLFTLALEGLMRLAPLYAHLRRHSGVYALLATLLIVLSYFVPGFPGILLTKYYSPLNFIPYVFIALYLARRLASPAPVPAPIPVAAAGDRSAPLPVTSPAPAAPAALPSGRWLAGLLVVGLVAAVVEWRLLPDRKYIDFGAEIAIPIYGRVSEVALATAVLLAAFRVTRPATGLLSAVSASSMTLYTFHPVVMSLFAVFALPTHATLATSLVYFLVVFLLTLAFSRLLTTHKDAIFS